MKFFILFVILLHFCNAQWWKPKWPEIKIPNIFNKPKKPTVCPKSGGFGSSGLNPFSAWKRDCSKTDGSFKDIIPGPNPFSNRGQLDGKYRQKDLKNFEKDLIIKTAEIAQMTYEVKSAEDNFWNLRKWESGEKTNNQAKHLRLKSVVPFNETSRDGFYNTVGLVAKMDHKIGEICFVGFRGSYNAQDWAANFNIAEGGPSWPHLNGYYRPFYKKSEIVLDKIYDLTPSCNHFIFTGHSLGGAVSSISAIELQQRLKTRKPVSISLINFASPRPGTSKIAKKAESLNFIFLIDNKGDLVPTVPPVSAGFVQLTWTSKINGRNNLFGYYDLVRAWAIENSLLDNLRSDILWARLRTWFERDSVHMMNTQYIRLLRRIFYEQDDRDDMQ